MQSRILVGDAANTLEYALGVARRLNCLAENPTETGCGSCLSCKVFDKNSHPDTFMVEGTKASGIGVDDVRQQIIAPMATKPFKYKHKVFVIQKAETLTPQAQNSLLKTIEEPAPYGVFLFLAAHEFNFLPTILSRCSLEKIGHQTNPTTNQPDLQLQEIAKDLIESTQNMDMLEAFLSYRSFEPYKDSKETLQTLLNLMYCYAGEKISAAAQAGEPISNRLLAATKIIQETKKILTQNGNTQLALELMMAKITNG
ncbi:MAG: hypothetical protein FWC78_02350 [Defluviitaleaceae bacterium]|nr:hypothetical protein [Defluviitaleaceae bacterium]